MSTRCSLIVKNNADENIIYHHCDGYPGGVGTDVKHYLKENFDKVKAPDGFDFLIHEFKEGNVACDDEYEIDQHGLPGDIEYLYEIDLTKETVDEMITCYKIPWAWPNCDKDYTKFKVKQIPD